MALQTSGPISLLDIEQEFGGGAPTSLTEYYRGWSYVPDHAGTSSIPTSGAISMSSFYGTRDLLSFASGTDYISNGSATSSLTSDYGSWTLHNTVWDYQQSGYIWTFTAGTYTTGSLRIRSTADPDPAPRSNSGNDRELKLYKNGTNIVNVSAAASNNAVLDTTQTVTGGDEFKLYMNNAMDWRDLGGFERIVNIYITGA